MTDIRETAQRVLGYLDDIARQLTTDPQAHVPLQILGPSEAFAADIVALATHAANTGGPQMNQQPSQNGQQQVAPSLSPVNMREAFLNDMRASEMYPQAAQTVSPPMLAALARVYLMGRASEVKRTSGGWKTVEAIWREYEYVMNPGWVPDHSWRWWESAPPAAQPFRMAGAAGSSLASHMAAPPVWG